MLLGPFLFGGIPGLCRLYKPIQSPSNDYVIRSLPCLIRECKYHGGADVFAPKEMPVGYDNIGMPSIKRSRFDAFISNGWYGFQRYPPEQENEPEKDCRSLNFLANVENPASAGEHTSMI